MGIGWAWRDCWKLLSKCFRTHLSRIAKLTEGKPIRVTMSQKRRKSTVPSSQNRTVRSSLAQDDGPEDLSFTQPSSSQVQRGLERLTPAQVDRKGHKVKPVVSGSLLIFRWQKLVQFILIKDQKKVPIKRADIVRHVVKEYRNIYPEIMKRVTRTFEQVFGLNLVEIDIAHSRITCEHHLKQNINKLETESKRKPGELASMSLGDHRTGLLFVILSIIFMKGGVVKESVVWNTLRKLRVEPGEKHEDFGDVKKLVTEEFVRQKNLEYVRIPHTDPVEYEFRWGLRAETEVSKLKMLQL
ncbi:hypothetical protein AGOR_G00066540 [Albula goreensis]|uniref:MAGE domain-containing protein n=1 Tax=Albula goreensis TaxID=1534307 RepID=A0A8T3DS72_9TELE|nr:hypothetical protein AGOR_G00066540 [Albula goreensis]